MFQIDEIIMPTSNTDEMANEITRRYAVNGRVSHVAVYPDAAGNQRKSSAAGRTDIGILRARGFVVNVGASNPAVRDRVNKTNSAFEAADGTRRAFVSPRCGKSIEAYERHTYRDGTNEPNKRTVSITSAMRRVIICSIA